MNIGAVNMILYCRNWHETVGFYRGGIQLPVLSANEWFVEFRLNDTARLSVANEARTTIKSGGGQGLTISLQITDIEQVQNTLTNTGISLQPLKEVWGTKAFYVRDPEGNRIEFWEGIATVERKT